VQHAVGEQDIGGDDAGAVHEDLAIDEGDGDVAAAQSGDGAVGQRAAVGDGAVDDMVLQDGSGFFGGEIAQGGADVLERFVVWGEDGQVGGGVDCFCEVGCVDCTEESAKTGFLGDGADVRRDCEEAVDDVDDAAVECNVLTIVSLHRVSVDWNDLQLR
jgi:hypothetical protein